MATEVKVPALGESVTEATVSKWFKKPGDAVKVDEPLCELETDKVTVEVPSPVAGALAEIVAADGAEIEVGALLCLIAEGAEGSVSAAPAAAPAAAAAAPAAAPAAAAPAPAKAAPAANANLDYPLAPAVRKLIEDNSLDAARIPATGKDGRLTKEDVLAFIANGGKAPSAAAKAAAAAVTPGAAATAASGPREERVKMTRLRKRVAERLKDAQNTAAMLTTFNEIDMTNVMALRNQYKDNFEKKHGCRLGFMSFFIKACVTALQEIPAVNAEIDGDELVYKNYYDISVAVGGPQGLVVPVVRDCDKLSFAEIEKKIADYGKKARDGKLTMEDMQGGTFTVSNGGVYGSLMSTPILNPPQSGILGMHKTMMRPMVMPDGSIQARPMMYLALSYDHRIIDGKEAVTFLVRVKECLEDPARILMDA
ncbi:2-oxoglutarate dehydrogenase complex dihydrolipoyllysine-residue succinyltransferase [Insolitispirillum peregrinum]|uniref:2-oxoglutarate dehydrogenase complex dihydrolipoyllysine-residue succinyltransferase n=1 Tax=Insolitispirillum peregrinum TaxID=80876 RepID=UPI00360FCCA6